MYLHHIIVSIGHYRSINWHPRASNVICLIEPPKNATKGTWWCPNNWCKGSHRVWTKDLVVSLLEPLERIGVPKNVQWHVGSSGYFLHKTRDLQSGVFLNCIRKRLNSGWLNFWFPPLPLHKCCPAAWLQSSVNSASHDQVTSYEQLVNGI